jgi:meiotic recombination protein DMC1
MFYFILFLKKIQHYAAIEDVLLVQIAEEFNVAVVITNQVMSDPSGGAMFVVDPKKPVGGHVMAHASTFRLSLRKGKGEQRLVKIVQAPTLAEAEASYQITATGISDCSG